MDFKVLFQEFCRSIVRNRHLELAERHGDWTSAVKASLGRLGKRHGYASFLNDDRRKSGSYLWDVAWCVEDRVRPSTPPRGAGIEGLRFPVRPYRRLALSAQVEWGRPGQRPGTQVFRQNLEEVFRDFYKLLDAKSQYKVMVYTSWSYPQQGGATGLFVQGFERLLADYENHTAGEKYLFIEFHDTGRTIYGYQCAVPRRGPRQLVLRAVGQHGYPGTW